MKRILSYIFPFRIKQYTSEISGPLEVSYINGKKILDTNNSNYSFGSLQRILHKGLLNINFDSRFNTILVLGLGGGSVVETIREDFKSAAFIELVEIDPEIISIAKKEFSVDRFTNINIVCADAANYINSSDSKFDLIIVDIFVDNNIPEIFTQPDFIKKLALRINTNGIILFNTMRDTLKNNTLLLIINTFSESGLTIKLMEKVESSNDLIIAAGK